MSIKNEAVIQSVTINGAILTTATGMVAKGSKAESALKVINAEAEKMEVIERARKMAVILKHEYENQTYTPNINYLESCLANRNQIVLMNWILGTALSIVRQKIDCQDILYSTSEHLLYMLEDAVNGHS